MLQTSDGSKCENYTVSVVVCAVMRKDLKNGTNNNKKVTMKLVIFVEEVSTFYN